MTIEEQFSEIRDSFTDRDMVECVVLAHALEMSVLQLSLQEAIQMWKPDASS